MQRLCVIALTIYCINLFFWCLIGLPVTILAGGFGAFTSFSDATTVLVDESLAGRPFSLWMTSPFWLLPFCECFYYFARRANK
jgi:hypothetical protein